MARLFISHSSYNNDRAIEVRDWLAKNGWDDVFLDLDPEEGIVAGQRWKDALRKAAQRCEMVLALISAEWLASPWCRAEIVAAQLMGKKVIVALIGIDKVQVPPDLNDEQWIDLIGDPNAYTRLREGLRRSGLDPSSFPFEAGRRPYPGFAFFEEKDAAIFFGREAQIVRGLDKIRSLVRAGVDRMLVILGASGSGKSSFLRAGLWPRLKRDDRTWLPLPTIRPERAVISGKFGLVQALQQMMSEVEFADGIRQRGLPRSRAGIQDFIEKEGGLVKIFAALREIAQVPGLSGETTQPPTVVVSLDQGEELFNEDGRDEAGRFIDILTDTLKADPHALAILVMRSDSFPQLQTDAQLADLPKDTFTLDMMLEGSYRPVIEGPAGLVQPIPLKIDPRLTDALLQDVSGQDALPLLAFTLAHLYKNYAADNELNLADYEKLGRLKGVIATTVREAFAEGAAKGELPKDAKAQLALVRMAFIPHLARVNPAGQFIRRIATRAEIPAEARPLIDRFAERRLLIRDRRKIAGEDLEVIEVAHEAMLREWRELHDALLEEREFLVAKGQLEGDVAEWRMASESHKPGALLSGNKLLRARDWLLKRPQDLSVEERQFIRASVDKDAERRRRSKFAIALAFLIILGFAGYAFFEARRAEANFREAQKTESHFRAEQAKEAGADAVTAALIALEGLPDATAPDDMQRSRPFVNEAWNVLYGARLKQRERAILSGHARSIVSAVFAPDGGRTLTASVDKTARLWDGNGKPLATLEGHTGAVTRAVFAPDGGRILTASADKTARLWDGNGKPLAILEGHTDAVTSAVFAPDGGRILTASQDKTARLWDGNGKPLAVLEGHTELVTSAVFAPDGGRILTASADKTARLWDGNGKPLAVLEGHTELVTSAVFAPDGGRILTASRDNTARLWDGNGKPLAILEGHTSRVIRAVFAPDGGRILTASWDNTARLWDGNGKPLAILDGHTDAVTSAVFASDDGRILTASWDKTARLWDGNGKPLAILDGHTDAVTSAVFAPDGGRILTASWDKTARLWDGNAKPLAILDGHTDEVTSAVFAPDGGRTLTASADKTARLWDGNGKPLAILDGHTGRVIRAVFAPDGGRILTASWDNTARLWGGNGKPLAILDGHTELVTSAVFAPDGGRILTASADKTARLWDGNGKPLAILEGHTDAVTSAVFAPDGGRILTASADKTARLWDGNGKPLATLEGHTDLVTSAVFAPDGGRILTASQDKTARLWDGNAKPLAILEDHTELVTSAVFAPDGGRILTASADKTARLWDGNGKPLAILEGHTGAVFSAAFAPDGGRTLTASWDKTARLWDGNGKPLAILEGHTDAVTSAVFAPDGGRILTASADKTARRWEVFRETQALIDRVKAEVPRCLTPEQRRRFFLETASPSWCAAMHKWPHDGATP